VRGGCGAVLKSVLTPLTDGIVPTNSSLNSLPRTLQPIRPRRIYQRGFAPKVKIGHGYWIAGRACPQYLGPIADFRGKAYWLDKRITRTGKDARALSNYFFVAGCDVGAWALFSFSAARATAIVALTRGASP
jgi:hypothetical protein